MGEVYRAHDSRLHRDVAVKILPSALSRDPDRRRRFEREAHAIAALSHPHICTIHDVGRQDDIDYLVLELVAGESLAARLKRGPIPADELLACARDIADALAHAHEKGVIHRDLKPGNVMVTPAGAKVLDFGLAAMMRPDEGAGLDAAATATAPLTAAGSVIGTLAYMAPEQIEGRPADARSDIFAFGTTLFEIATGKRAFDAPSTPALIGAILRDQPPALDEIRPGLPPGLERLIRACLQKRPGDRLASMHDAAIALGWIDASRRDLATATDAESPGGVSRRTLIGAGGVVMAAAALGYVLGRGRQLIPSRSSFVYDLALPDGTSPGAGLALSRDGRWLAVSTASTDSKGFGLHLWIRDLTRDRWHRILAIPHEVAQGAYPFWSPDATQLAFHLNRRLVRVTVPDGEPIDICAVSETPGGNLEYRGGVWLDDNTIVVGQANAGLLLVPANGGEPRVLVEKGEGDLGLKHPVLAGGRTILYLGQSQTRPEVRLVNVDAPADTRVVVPSYNSPAYDSGTLYFLRQDALVGQSCDLAGRLSGDVRRVALDTLSGRLNNGYGQVTAGGGHVAVMNTRGATRQPHWHARGGGSRRPFGEPGDQTTPSVSPDGQRIVISRRAPGESSSSLWITDLEGSAARRLTTDYDDRFPIWSAHGDRIMFRSTRGVAGNGNIFMVTTEGTPTITALAMRIGSMYPQAGCRTVSRSCGRPMGPSHRRRLAST